MMRHNQRSLTACLTIAVISAFALFGISEVLFLLASLSLASILTIIFASAIFGFLLFHSWIEALSASLVFAAVTTAFDHASSKFILFSPTQQFMLFFFALLLGLLLGAFIRASMKHRRR
ncbi:MAG: hypothetical protein ACYCQJ_12960 [Nitrososphaerales archaeon]